MKEAVIVADGEYPVHRVPLKYLSTATFIICCDGAIKNLDKHGIIPDLIIGDLDSISSELKIKYSEKLYNAPTLGFKNEKV